MVIDFIDMDSQTQRDGLLQILREATQADRNRTNVVGFTSLGLVEMTRKKVRRPLSKQLGHVCPACQGAGIVDSYENIAYAAARELWARGRAAPGCKLLVETSAPVAGWLRTVGKPENVSAWVAVSEMAEGEAYRIAPADCAALPAGARELK